MSTVDLWPDFLLDEIPRTPKHILLEQATALGTKTNNVVQGSVQLESIAMATSHMHSCFIVQH